ncbi:conserved hypothetical protein [Lodderomyces elongisporus NRRL YB-4239]|uniref:LSM12 anticodon-binding domain-containing protein n=1 Tax=Lodderomyces elongisporus (strain ATCC 11503 / CBS 2605 / JCM 1781 / NBRC 1676 / NRRL YB-4239) TaxID=379508 RepID=A5E673_LODEL|nr:conserved hypothetical protein [Lodderomyces elongisporus NRRL YB-4239]
MSIQSFDQVFNLKIKITTLLDQEITGVIYTYSLSNEILVLKTSNLRTSKDKELTSPHSTYRVINTSFIKSIMVLQPFSQKNKRNSKPYKGDDVQLNPINVEDLKKYLSEKTGKESHEQHEQGKQLNSSSSKNETSPALKTSQVQAQGQDQNQGLNQTQTQAQIQAQPQTQQQQHLHQQLASEPRHINSTSQHSKQTSPTPTPTPDPNPIASQLYEKLIKLYGETNIKYGNPKHSEIIVHDEIKIHKPFTNTTKNIQVITRTKESKFLASLTRALKQFWLEVDNEKKGG